MQTNFDDYKPCREHFEAINTQEILIVLYEVYLKNNPLYQLDFMIVYY